MRAIGITVLLLSLLIASGVQAQANPVEVARAVQERLFDAQVALLRGDTAAAESAVTDARSLYAAGFEGTFTGNLRDIERRITAAFDRALAGTQAGDGVQLAAARGMIWTSLLDGSSRMVAAAVESNDASAAALWLPLRDFRVSTRFSRPGADATLAVKALQEGKMLPAAALEAVRADLLDTYQAQLTASLAAADEAHSNGFATRQAEETALAAGYFEILAPAYEQQRGAAALTDVRAAFAALAAVPGNRYEIARSQVDKRLAGFRAAPLSSDELARRAGQLSRFIALVPVEYARGVRGGVVTNDIEIQEALTFYEGAYAAFADVQPALADRDPQAAGRIAELLPQVVAQIRGVVEPGVLQGTVDEISGLLSGIIPPEWRSSTGSDIDVILSLLDQLEAAVAQHEYTLAESSRLDAYALLELGMEQRLRGFAPDLAARIESLFWEGTRENPGLASLLATRAPQETVSASMMALRAAFDDARLLLDSGRTAPGAVVGNAAVIVFREGLEAVLILASLLASLRTAEERRYRRPLVAGAVLALGATAVSWWLANNLLAALLPLGERLEAIVSLVAIGVLLLITNWFFHKVYWTGWMANFHARKRRLIGGVAVITLGQTTGLVLLGFTSIYREGFETVLFLQSLVLEAGSSVVLQGVALGLFGTAIVGLITFALQVRLPYKKMLIVTGVLIGVVLLTMVGNTVHIMQAVGWLPITPIPGVYFPHWMGQWFGTFATWQGIILQAVAGTFVIGSYFLAEHQSKRQRRQRVRPAAAGM
ncbi:MAG: iron permease [Chloroflexi bacterium]|nr:iron permease [Chloroflexota bacterium]